MQLNTEIEDLDTLGSNVSKQVKTGIKTEKVLSPNTKYGENKLNKEEVQ